MVDIGTGDGLFVYQSARANRNRFYIGIDANPRPLEKISEKIHRRPGRGGLPNVLFLQSAVEDLPPELDGVADVVHVQFPWGSLLRTVAAGERPALDNLRRICAPGAFLEVIIGIDPERDRSELERLALSLPTIATIDSDLVDRYHQAGFELMQRGMLSPAEWSELPTSWARRLRGSGSRSVLSITARAR